MTVLQKVEGLPDQAAAERVRTDLGWQYALGIGADEEAFDFSVLSEFRAKVAGHGLEQVVLDALSGTVLITPVHADDSPE